MGCACENTCRGRVAARRDHRRGRGDARVGRRQRRVCSFVNAGEDEWHEYGSDEVVIMDEDVYVHPRPEFGDELVGHYVQVHVAGAWLDAVIVEADLHEGREEICIQYAKYPSADPEWPLYDSDDVIYRD